MNLIHPPIICIHCKSVMEFWGSHEYSPDIIAFICKSCPNRVKQNFLWESKFLEPGDQPPHYQLTKLISHNIIIKDYTFAQFPDLSKIRVIQHISNKSPPFQIWEFYNHSLTHEFAIKFIDRIQSLKAFL